VEAKSKGSVSLNKCYKRHIKKEALSARQLWLLGSDEREISEVTYQESARSTDDVDTEWFESFVEVDDGLATRYDGAGGWIC